jgi:hypothetical protein
MAPAREEENSQGLRGYLAYSFSSRSAASWGMKIWNGVFGLGAGDHEIACFILRGPLAGIIQRWYTLREIKNDVFL